MVSIALALLLIAFAAPAAADGGVPETKEKGALVMVTSRWDSSCDARDIAPFDDECEGWYDEITNDKSEPKGHSTRAWWADGFQHNGNMVDSKFVDDSVKSWGEDDHDDNADEPDALLVGTHGSHGGEGYWNAKMRVDESGDGNCRATQAHMRLGDHDLEFLHLNSCHSMCESTWFDEWPETFRGLHQVNGFSGIVWTGYIAPGSLWENFADDAFYISIAESWIDNTYRNEYVFSRPGDPQDQCPVSLGAGRSEGSCDTRMSSETYAWVYDDPGDADTFMAIFVANCEAYKGHGALPRTGSEISYTIDLGARSR